jgi:HEAT repeat protein
MKHSMGLVAMALVLLARGASAGDDGQQPAPAQPVDVPGFWTADELRRIDEGLAVLNCTRKDLGFQKRPIDDPFRLKVVNQILDDPLSIGPVAAEWDAVARTGEAESLIDHALETLRLPNFGQHDGRPGGGGIRHTAAGLSRRALERIDSVLHASAYGLWSLDVDISRAVLEKALHSQIESIPLSPRSDDLSDSQFLTEIGKLNYEEFSRVGALLNECAHLVAVLREQKYEWTGRETLVDQFGNKVVLYGVGDDVHGPEDDDAVLVIDLGGNDTYTHGASANLLKNHPVSIVIDLGGNDQFIGENDFSFGGALGGVAIQWKVGGNDTYRGGNCSCGAGILGVGILVDEGGDDVYRVKDFGEGAGAFGIGLLLDKGGNDTYHADLYGQGFGSTWGCGMLVDLAGNDVYDAGGKHVDEPLWRDRYQSLSQGFGFGMRPDASGGVGVLVDVSGNDRYSCDIFGQGCSYWFSLGLLIDDDGNDTYCCGQYGQGAGIHLSCGMLLDRHGQDCYYDANGVGQGGAHDYGVGFLVDREGDDYYAGGGCAQGSGHTNSVGMLIDDAGDDGYATVRGISQGSSSWTRNTGGIGLLLDGAGHDQYTETTRDSRIAVRDTIGACIDEPTPAETASANPMNAAISDEDVAKKVEAEGKTDGKWDLDKLWKLVTAWEVGDNTKIMPEARKQFFALGAPALDRAFANFDDKHGLVFRAVEFTLKEFAKTQREDVVKRLIEKTKDADKQIRKNSVVLVGNLEVREALPRLTEMLATDVDTQAAVLAALATMKTAPPEVVALLKASKEPVGVQAAVCLGAVGDDSAITALVGALGPDTAFPVRLAATQQLASLGGKAVRALQLVVTDHGAPVMQRRNALRALGGSKSWHAAEVVGPATNDEDRWVRLSAMTAASELVQSLSSATSDQPKPSTDESSASEAAGHLLALDLAQARKTETDPLVKRVLLGTQAK